MDPDTFWHSLGGGAILAAALAFGRVLLDYGFRGGERRTEQEDRRRAQQRDAEARLERILQDRLSDADRRLQRCELEVQTERVRAATFERENARIVQAHDLLKEELALLQADHAQLLRKQRVLLEQLERFRCDGSRGCDAA